MAWLVIQMWLWLALAALLGLIVGIWICTRKETLPADDLDIEVAHLRARCEEIDAEKIRLRARVAELEAELSDQMAAHRQASASVENAQEEVSGQTDTDDFSKIKGIGPMIESKLRALGVRSFLEISNWTDEQVQGIDEKLRLKGRILRDNWREQARILSENGDD